MQTNRRDFRHTKIICTLGPASSQSDMIENMAKAGMNIARLNMSHGDHDSHLLSIRRIRSLNRTLNHPVAILLDLKGPEIRTGEVHGADLNLKVGEIYTVTVVPSTNTEEQSIHIDYRDMISHLKVGDRITVDNGLINLQVLEMREHDLRCKVLDGGTLGSRKHINLPGVRVNLPGVTEKDKVDIRFGLEHDVDFIALSFVRNAEAVLEARKIVDDAEGHARIIAKIENQEGVDNFDSILQVADGIMIARGDLGVEVDFSELPVMQREMTRKCVVAGKPVIVATHLLESMIHNPMPTRAEVSDVANAVYEEADAVMLSGETASGKHPARCVQVMDKIVRRMEKVDSIGSHLQRRPQNTREELARSACRLADAIGSPAIVVVTRRGILGQLVASFHPRRAIIYAFTNMSTTRRKLWLNRSVVPFKMDFSNDPEKTVIAAFDKLRKRSRVLPGDQVVVVSDVVAGDDRVAAIQVRVFE
ncbi:MAG TPA: pyruvate kinase [Polyangiales bacterium]|nr:pyruvate kinase [Polyangiales bacterium]